MDYRLTLAERCTIAAQLRRHILSKEDLARLKSIEDPELQPHEIAAPSYAFEFFLDRHRDMVRERLHDSTVYNVAWSHTALRMDEETMSVERLARMATEIFMSQTMNEESLETIAESLWMKEYDDCGVELMCLKLLLFEIFYELVREYSRIRAEAFMK